MKKKKILTVLIIVFSVLLFAVPAVNEAKADDLSDELEKQIQQIDLSELDEYFNGVSAKEDEIGFTQRILKILKGEYDLDYSSFFKYAFSFFGQEVKNDLPILLSIIAIALLSFILTSVKGNKCGGVRDIVIITCICAATVLLSYKFSMLFEKTKIVLENITNLSEIMSPIILTLMVASGGNVSASIYKPSAVFFSGAIIHVFSYVILPLIVFSTVTGIASTLLKDVKLNKFSAFISSVIKWIIGLTVAIFGIFLSVQGITGATFDGVSFKVAKYAISNSIPMVGGLISGGFDLVVAGSVLIKNAVGVGVVLALFYTVLSPVLIVAVFSLMLKLASAFCETLCSDKLSALCSSFSKSLSFCAVSMITVGFMLFFNVLLMTVSANAFI